MSNTGIKKILFAVISVLIVATVVAVSFAVWDTKTSKNSFQAIGGERVNVSVATSSSNFNANLVPDGVIPSSDGSALYIYSDFTPSIGKDDTKNVKLHWRYNEVSIDGTSMLLANKSDLASNSVLDCWVADIATLDKPSNAITQSTGELVSGKKYYFVVKFRMFKYKEYTHSNNKVYKFYSNGKYTLDGSGETDISKELLSGLGITVKDGLSLYENSPYQSEYIDVAKYNGYSGKAITTKIEIFAVNGAAS